MELGLNGDWVIASGSYVLKPKLIKGYLPKGIVHFIGKSICHLCHNLDHHHYIIIIIHHHHHHHYVNHHQLSSPSSSSSSFPSSLLSLLSIIISINILPLGAAFIGIAPHIAYKQFLESLCGNGYIIVATPYEVDTDFLSICDSILAGFDQLMLDIYKEYQLVDEVKQAMNVMLGYDAMDVMHWM